MISGPTSYLASLSVHTLSTEYPAPPRHFRNSSSTMIPQHLHYAANVSRLYCWSARRPVCPWTNPPSDTPRNFFLASKHAVAFHAISIVWSRTSQEGSCPSQHGPWNAFNGEIAFFFRWWLKFLSGWCLYWGDTHCREPEYRCSDRR